MGSRASRGKILKILKKKNSQDESVSRASRSSRSSKGKFLKSFKRKDPQEERSSRFSGSSGGKILRGFLRAVRMYVADCSPNLLKLDMYYQDYKNR